MEILGVAVMVVGVAACGNNQSLDAAVDGQAGTRYPRFGDLRDDRLQVAGLDRDPLEGTTYVAIEVAQGWCGPIDLKVLGPIFP